MGYVGDVKIDYLMFRDLDVGEEFTVIGHESWIFHGRGTMIKTAPSIENDKAKNWNAAYTNNLRDNRTVAYLRTGTEVERVAGPKGAAGTLHIHIVESDASIWDQLNGASFDKAASGKCFVEHLEAYVCESYPDADVIEIVYGAVSMIEAYSIEEHSSVRVPEPGVMANLKNLSERVRYEAPWEVEEGE